ncbi:MAG: SAM-dependent methyltransferase [Mycobacterium sp.]|nr:SAM-dependent methyltransferase [Mycobacterium sp.]
MLNRLFTTVVRPPYVWLRNASTNMLFERRLGVRTTWRAELDELGIAPDGHAHYEPVGWLTLRRILPPRTVSTDDVFLDVGSGMGRAVLLAAGYPFRRVIGVELSTQLNAIAQDNLDRCRDRLRCQHIQLVNADAVEYEIPDDVTVIFMYNPVRGANFAAVVKNVLDSYDRRPRMMRIAYANPIEEPTLLYTGRIRMVRQVRGCRPRREWSRSNSVRLYAVQPSPPDRDNFVIELDYEQG